MSSVRSLPEWVGATPDTKAPDRVRDRVFETKGGRCGQCSRKINAGERWTLEHIIAIINGGANAESNLGVTCDWCLPAKNAADVKQKAKSARIRARHVGIKKPSRMAGSKDSNIRKCVDGRVVYRDSGLPVNGGR